MPKGTNQKLKLYYLSRILLEKTDLDHGLTMPEIKRELERYSVTADRKSLYDDMQALSELGIEIIGAKEGKSYTYRVGTRQFELAECKLLVDAIQSSKFITERKSADLIRKIETFVSHYEASQLNRQVMIAGRVKTMNESIYYNVDAIHSAIGANRQIRFEYLQWTLQKTLAPRREAPYEVSPFALSYDDENYYLIAYDATEKKVKHFRVDKMRKIKMLSLEREGKKHFERFNPVAYAKANFGMYGGETVNVKLRFSNRLTGVVIDRFGKDLILKPDGKEHFTTRVDVAVSGQFFGWMFALGEDAQILSPADVVKEMKTRAKRIAG